MNTIRINNQNVPIDYRRSKRAKRMRMQMGTNKTIQVVVPPLVPDMLAKRFVQQNEQWIKKQLNKVELIHEKHPPHEYRQGETFFYLGEKYTLVYKPHPLKRPQFKIEGNQFVVYLNEEIKNAEAYKQSKKVVEAFYKKKAEEIVYDRLEFFNEFYDHKYNKVTLRNQKSRWGSCSSLKNLNFNFRLVMAPIEVIDYVIVHELCHLKQMNHSPKFWALVEKQVPDYKVKKKWLKENHYLLEI